MPESAPFQINDISIKDTLEGNRYTSGWRFGDDFNSVNDSAFLVQARNPDDDYVIIGPLVLSVPPEYDFVRVIKDPTVANTGTEREAANSRKDAPAPDSTVYTAPRFGANGTVQTDYFAPFPDGESIIEIPRIIVPHGTDMIYDLKATLKSNGRIEESDRAYAAKVRWSEVTNSIVPKIN